MKFNFVRKTQGRVKTYEGKTVMTGEEVEFSGHFAEKAMRHPDYVPVGEDQPAKKVASKKKVSRKKVSRRG